MIKLVYSNCRLEIGLLILSPISGKNKFEVSIAIEQCSSQTNKFTKSCLFFSVDFGLLLVMKDITTEIFTSTFN